MFSINDAFDDAFKKMKTFATTKNNEYRSWENVYKTFARERRYAKRSTYEHFKKKTKCARKKNEYRSRQNVYKTFWAKTCTQIQKSVEQKHFFYIHVLYTKKLFSRSLRSEFNLYKGFGALEILCIFVCFKFVMLSVCVSICEHFFFVFKLKEINSLLHTFNIKSYSIGASRDWKSDRKGFCFI